MGPAVRSGALVAGPGARLEDYLLRDARVDQIPEDAPEIHFWPHDVLGDVRARIGSCDYLAVLLSPLTLLPAVVSIADPFVLVHSLDASVLFACGFYDTLASGEDGGGRCLRQHAEPGRGPYTRAEAGFGPLLYLGGALGAGCASQRRQACTFSYAAGRTPAASRLWANLHSHGLAEEGWAQSRTGQPFKLDVLTARRVLERSGLVVWVNPRLAATVLPVQQGGPAQPVPPPPDVLASMSAVATTSDWFAIIFEACARYSRAPHEYIAQCYERVLERGDLRNNLGHGLQLAHAALAETPRSNGRLNTISLAKWTRAATTWDVRGL